MVEVIKLERLRLPLQAPYRLAFGAITHFDTIVVRLLMDGKAGIGEATILSGYTHETIDGAWRAACAAAASVVGLNADAAKDRLARDLAEAPFTATALVSAVEMAHGHSVLDTAGGETVPVLAGINATDARGIGSEIELALAAGYETLKIKVGFDIDGDLDRVRFIQRCNAGRAKLRIDANQGYSHDDGVRFAGSLKPDGIELLEQPCAAADWEAAAAVASHSTVPLMLDESIYSLADIRRAADLGAAFVKLKLMKMGGLDRLIEGLALIRALGMEPVLGNGVASDVGCWMEACVARRHIGNAGEMNGFLRQAAPLAAAALTVSNGRIVLPPGRALPLDVDRIAAATVDRAGFSSKPRLRAAAT